MSSRGSEGGACVRACGYVAVTLCTVTSVTVWRENIPAGQNGTHNSTPALCLINQLLQISPIRLGEEIQRGAVGCWEK